MTDILKLGAVPLLFLVAGVCLAIWINPYTSGGFIAICGVFLVLGIICQAMTSRLFYRAGRLGDKEDKPK